MNFRIGEKVLINSSDINTFDGYTGIVTNRYDTIIGTMYNVKLDDLKSGKKPLIKVVPEKDIISLERKKDINDTNKKVFGTDGLISTLEEIIETLKSDNSKLIENVVNHDYYEQENKHYITINMALKENK